MNTACKVALGAFTAMTLVACGEPTAPGPGPGPVMPSPPSTSEMADGWVGGAVELRDITVLIRIAPPPQLRELFSALGARTEDPDMRAFFQGFAAGGSGSGFVMILRQKGQDEESIVTNRHVVDHSMSADITFSNGAALSNLEIVHTDDQNDLAVLAFPNSEHPSGTNTRPAAWISS